jgi:hypothetical protein
MIFFHQCAASSVSGLGIELLVVLLFFRSFCSPAFGPEFLEHQKTGSKLNNA